MFLYVSNFALQIPAQPMLGVSAKLDGLRAKSEINRGGCSLRSSVLPKVDSITIHPIVSSGVATIFV